MSSSQSRKNKDVRIQKLRPKKECCADKPRCTRCPIRMLAEGNLDPADARSIFARARNRKELAKVGKKLKRAA